MYTRHFGLNENPFALPPDPGYLYLGHSHQEALAHLRYGIEEGGGFVQLTGEVGTGKTLLVRTAIEKIPDSIDVALVLYPVLSVTEFIAAICDELHVPYRADSVTLKDLIGALNAHLLESHSKGRRTVLVIDEAQNLNREVLEQIRLLTNLETTKQKLLQIILIGQPELDSLLAQRDLRQLAQRVTARYSLRSLTREETTYYIRHRSRVAGARSELFSQAAMHAVYRLAKGVPRLVNVICDRALLGVYADGKQQADARIVRRAAAELDLYTRRRAVWPRIAAFAMLATFAVGIATWFGAPALSSLYQRSEEIPAGSQTSMAAQPADISGNAAPNTLIALLEERAGQGNTEAALMELFVRWGLNTAGLTSTNACARALQAGLRCLHRSGTWNNLRSHGRPAIIELIDARGHVHQVLITALGTTHATIEHAGSRQNIPLAEIDRMWYGDYMLLWRADLLADGILRRGAKGDAVMRLRRTLAEFSGSPPPDNTSGEFDAALATRVQEFQRAHRLSPDGVVGEMTALYLSGYTRDASLPSLTKLPGGE